MQFRLCYVQIWYITIHLKQVASHNLHAHICWWHHSCHLISGCHQYSFEGSRYRICSQRFGWATLFPGHWSTKSSEWHRITLDICCWCSSSCRHEGQQVLSNVSLLLRTNISTSGRITRTWWQYKVQKHRWCTSAFDTYMSVFACSNHSPLDGCQENFEVHSKYNNSWVNLVEI